MRHHQPSEVPNNDSPRLSRNTCCCWYRLLDDSIRSKVRHGTARKIASEKYGSRDEIFPPRAKPKICPPPVAVTELCERSVQRRVRRREIERSAATSISTTTTTHEAESRPQSPSNTSDKPTARRLQSCLVSPSSPSLRAPSRNSPSSSPSTLMA